MNKPTLHAVHDQAADGTAYRAELTAHIDAPACSPDPVVRMPVDLSGTWWKGLRADLETLAGRPAPQITTWTTAHSDLHLSNITTTGVILDWEGWGLAPAAYDCALLLAYSLLEPTTAARVRAEFADVLNDWPGRAAQLVVAAELLQSASRGDHPDLTGPLRALVAEVAP